METPELSLKSRGRYASFLRLYFSTHQHIYALPYDKQASDEQESEPSESTAQPTVFARPLTELPFTGATWSSLYDQAVDDGIQPPLLYVRRQYDPYTLGEIAASFDRNTRLPLNRVILIRPSHTTPQIAACIESDGPGWYSSAILRMQTQQESFPLPSLEPERDDQQRMLYDVFLTSAMYEERLQPLVRLSYEHALREGRAILQREGGLLIRYDEDQDTLEWLNATYTLYAGLIADIDDPANRLAQQDE
jgi:hypothetical protein